MPKQDIKDTIKKIEKGKFSDSQLYAFLATFLSIVGVVIALIARRNDKYVMFYTKISLIIFILGLIAGLLQKVLIVLPLIGQIISMALSLLVIILWLLSWIYALSGQKKEIPVIRDAAKKLDL